MQLQSNENTSHYDFTGVFYKKEYKIAGQKWAVAPENHTTLSLSNMTK
jgi:hypothetical protein